MESIPCLVLKQVKQLYEQQITSHPELGHKWCEVVIKNKFRAEYSSVSSFLKTHQSMGVFLYGELLFSKNKTLQLMFQDLVKDLKDELDDNSASVIQDMLWGRLYSFKIEDKIHPISESVKHDLFMNILNNFASWQLFWN